MLLHVLRVPRSGGVEIGKFDKTRRKSHFQTPLFNLPCRLAPVRETIRKPRPRENGERWTARAQKINLSSRFQTPLSTHPLLETRVLEKRIVRLRELRLFQTPPHGLQRECSQDSGNHGRAGAMDVAQDRPFGVRHVPETLAVDRHHCRAKKHFDFDVGAMSQPTTPTIPTPQRGRGLASSSRGGGGCGR